MVRIENEKQYEAAMARINEFLEIVDENTPTDDKNSVELVLLSNLVADYEDIHYPIEKPSLVEVLKLRMYEMGLTQASMASLLGMNQPTLKQPRNMSTTLNIPPAVVLGV